LKTSATGAGSLSSSPQPVTATLSASGSLQPDERPQEVRRFDRIASYLFASFRCRLPPFSR